MKIRSKSTLFFALVVGVPAALFLIWDGFQSATDLDIIMGIFGLIVFLRVAQDAISQTSYDKDMARLAREKTIRYATYGKLAPVMPYIPGLFLILIFLSPSTSTDPMAPYIYLGLAAVTALQQLVVYLYVSYKMGLGD